MSFNIRNSAANDGPNAWTQRRALVVERIQATAPDILALQEALPDQVAELQVALKDYDFIAIGREDGATGGESVPIFFLRKRFALRDAGHFWLSDRPEQPGSKGWDAACPRIVTWVRLAFKESPWTELQVVNVHLDHEGERARIESARLLRKLAEAHGGQPLIVLGDFNCPPGSEPYRILTEDRSNLAELRDAHTLYSSSPLGEWWNGTYHAFEGRPRGGRIDWILHNRRFEPLEADIDHSADEGRFPSDHFPVTATLRLVLSEPRTGFT